MSTKTRLYVERSGSFGMIEDPTHDDLIAAMPRCRTCKWNNDCTVQSAAAMPEPEEFGCTEHDESDTTTTKEKGHEST